MPFGVMSGLDPRNSMLRGVTVPEREGAIFEENMCPDKPNAPMNSELDWAMQQRAHDSGRRLDEFINDRKGELHTAGEVWYLRLRCLALCTDDGAEFFAILTPAHDAMEPQNYDVCGRGLGHPLFCTFALLKLTWRMLSAFHIGTNP